jgi:hypothetical protein
MNICEENARQLVHEKEAAALREAILHTQHEWARAWSNGQARCPKCQGTTLSIINLNSEDSSRYETWSCSCGARWKVELRENALCVLEQDGSEDGPWIELEQLDQREEGAR